MVGGNQRSVRYECLVEFDWTAAEARSPSRRRSWISSSTTSGSVPNAAKVIAALHRGEKRLVFADSKRLVEMLGAELRARGVTTHLVHASLSLDERQRAEQAFAEGRDCVIVSTSALELGIDVGDLDRVIQAERAASRSPRSCSASAAAGGGPERCGTAVPRPRRGQFLLAAGLLLAWGRGFVEPVAPPPTPRHIVAQQLLALCLQEKRVGEHALDRMAAGPRADGLRRSDHRLPRSSRGSWSARTACCSSARRRSGKFGRRHFMGLMATFTAPPEFTVLHGRDEVGRTDPVLLVDHVDRAPAAAPRRAVLAGHLDRLEAAGAASSSLCRGRRTGALAGRRGRRAVVRDHPVHAGGAARRPIRRSP